MAILTSDEIFFTAFEPKQSNRFIVYMDGMPSYLVKGVSGVKLEQTAVALNHMNVQRFVKGKTKWSSLDFTLFDFIN